MRTRYRLAITAAATVVPLYPLRRLGAPRLMLLAWSAVGTAVLARQFWGFVTSAE